MFDHEKYTFLKYLDFGKKEWGEVRFQFNQLAGASFVVLERFAEAVQNHLIGELKM